MMGCAHGMCVGIIMLVDLVVVIVPAVLGVLSELVVLVVLGVLVVFCDAGRDGFPCNVESGRSVCCPRGAGRALCS